MANKRKVTVTLDDEVVRELEAGGNVSAQLNDAQGVALDRSGAVYIADPGNHRVRRVNPSGIIETVAGKGCFLRASASPFRKDVRLKLVAGAIDDAVVQAHHLQVAKREFLQLAEDRFDAFQQKRTSAAQA